MATKMSLKKWISILSVSIVINPTIYFVSQIPKNQIQVQERACSKDFSRWGGGGEWAHTMSKFPGYLPDWHVDIHEAVFY